MGFEQRVKKLTDESYSPTVAVSEASIREQVDGAVQEVYDNVKNALQSVTDGDSGGDNTKITPIYVLDTVQGALEELKQELINVVQAGLTADSVTDVFLSNLPGMVKARLGEVIERQNNTDLTLLYNDLNDFVENLSPTSFVDVMEDETYTAPETTAPYNAGAKTYEFDDTGLQLYQTVSLAFDTFARATALLIPKELKGFTPKQAYAGVTQVEGDTNGYVPTTSDKLPWGVNGEEVGITNVGGGSSVVDNTVTQADYGNIGLITMGAVTIGQELYTVKSVPGVGIKFYLTDLTEAPFSILGASIVANRNSIVKDSDGNLIITFHNGTSTIYTVVIDPSTATGNQLSNATIDDTGNTEITEVMLSIDLSNNILLGITSKHSGSTNSTKLNRRGRLGTVSGGVITWNFATEQITDSTDPVLDLALGLQSGVPVMLANFDNVGSVNFLIFLRRDTSLSSAGWLDASWSQITIDLVGSKYEYEMSVKVYGSDLGRIFTINREVNDLKLNYSDDNGANWTEIALVSNASKAHILQVKTTTVDHNAGDILIVYQNDSSGGIEQIKIADGTTTPSAPTILVASGTDPVYLKYADEITVDGKYGVFFMDGVNTKRYGKFVLGGGYILDLDTTVTVSEQLYAFTTQFSPILNGNAMVFERVSKGGLVYTDSNGGDDSVFKTTGKSVDLDGIGIAVY